MFALLGFSRFCRIPIAIKRKSLLSGWWLTCPSEKYEFVSWGDEIPNIREVIKAMFQTTNQLFIIPDCIHKVQAPIVNTRRWSPISCSPSRKAPLLSIYLVQLIVHNLEFAAVKFHRKLRKPSMWSIKLVHGFEVLRVEPIHWENWIKLGDIWPQLKKFANKNTGKYKQKMGTFRMCSSNTALVRFRFWWSLNKRYSHWSKCHEEVAIATDGSTSHRVQYMVSFEFCWFIPLLCYACVHWLWILLFFVSTPNIPSGKRLHSELERSTMAIKNGKPSINGPAMENHHAFLIGKPSISIDHFPWQTVSHNQAGSHPPQRLGIRDPGRSSWTQRQPILSEGWRFCSWKFISLDWFKGKSTGNHGFYHQI